MDTTTPKDTKNGLLLEIQDEINNKDNEYRYIDIEKWFELFLVL